MPDRRLPSWEETEPLPSWDETEEVKDYPEARATPEGIGAAFGRVIPAIKEDYQAAMEGDDGSGVFNPLDILSAIASPITGTTRALIAGPIERTAQDLGASPNLSENLGTAAGLVADVALPLGAIKGAGSIVLGTGAGLSRGGGAIEAAGRSIDDALNPVTRGRRMRGLPPKRNVLDEPSDYITGGAAMLGEPVSAGAIAGVAKFGGRAVESTGQAIKNLGEKLNALPEKFRGQFSGKPGDLKDAQTDFRMQQTDPEYRAATKEATSTPGAEVPGRYREALDNLERNVPEDVGRKDFAQLLDQPMTNTGLPPGTPVPWKDQPWETPHADDYHFTPLTRSRALEIMGQGKPTEAIRAPFDVTFLRRTKGKKPGEDVGTEREMTAHLGINKYVTGEGMGYDPKEYDLINVWEPKNLTPEALGRAPGAEGKFPGQKGYRMISVEGISKIRPGSKKGMVTEHFKPRARALKNLSK